MSFGSRRYRSSILLISASTLLDYKAEEIDLYLEVFPDGHWAMSSWDVAQQKKASGLRAAGRGRVVANDSEGQRER